MSRSATRYAGAARADARHTAGPVFVGAISAAASVQAVTETVNTKVVFVDDVKATVDQDIDFATLAKITGDCKMDSESSLSGCAAVTGTPQRGQVKVEGESGQDRERNVNKLTLYLHF